MRHLTDLEACILRDLTPTVPDETAVALLSAWKTKRGPETVATLEGIGYPPDSIAQGILIREGLEDVCDECGAVECAGQCAFGHIDRWGRDFPLPLGPDASRAYDGSDIGGEVGA